MNLPFVIAKAEYIKSLRRKCSFVGFFDKLACLNISVDQCNMDSNLLRMCSGDHWLWTVDVYLHSICKSLWNTARAFTNKLKAGEKFPPLATCARQTTQTLDIKPSPCCCERSERRHISDDFRRASCGPLKCQQILRFVWYVRTYRALCTYIRWQKILSLAFMHSPVTCSASKQF